MFEKKALAPHPPAGTFSPPAGRRTPFSSIGPKKRKSGFRSFQRCITFFVHPGDTGLSNGKALTSKPPSPRARGEGEDEGRAPTHQKITPPSTHERNPPPAAIGRHKPGVQQTRCNIPARFRRHVGKHPSVILAATDIADPDGTFCQQAVEHRTRLTCCRFFSSTAAAQLTAQPLCC